MNYEREESAKMQDATEAMIRMRTPVAQRRKENRHQKNEREMAEGTRCNGLCRDGGQCNC